MAFPRGSRVGPRLAPCRAWMRRSSGGAESRRPAQHLGTGVTSAARPPHGSTPPTRLLRGERPQPLAQPVLPDKEPSFLRTSSLSRPRGSPSL